MPSLDTSPSWSGSKIPTVCVIIPTYNRDDLLVSCLDHLKKQSFQSIEIVVVDNSPRDSIPAFLKEFDNLKWIPLFRNQGTAGAFNRGLAECKASPYVMLLNNDVELEIDCLAHLVETLDSDPNYSIAVPKLLLWSDSRFLDGVGDDLLLSAGAYRVGRGQLDFGQYETPEPVFSACATATLYRRSLFDDVGGFDEDFFAYHEDVDLCVRAQLRGHRCIFVPKARGKHRGSATLGTTFHPWIIRLCTRNHVLMILKNYPLFLLFRLAPRLLVFQILWLGLTIRKHVFHAWCKGFIESLFLLPKALAKRRDIQSKRLLSDANLLAKLQESEARIWRWHSSAHNPRPSKMLTLYFRIFGCPRTDS
jgi:GT2 family glycosyltransferase